MRKGINPEAKLQEILRTIQEEKPNDTGERHDESLDILVAQIMDSVRKGHLSPAGDSSQVIKEALSETIARAPQSRREQVKTLDKSTDWATTAGILDALALNGRRETKALFPPLDETGGAVKKLLDDALSDMRERPAVVSAGQASVAAKRFEKHTDDSIKGALQVIQSDVLESEAKRRRIFIDSLKCVVLSRYSEAYMATTAKLMAEDPPIILEAEPCAPEFSAAQLLASR